MKIILANLIFTMHHRRRVICAGFLFFFLSGCFMFPSYGSRQPGCGPYPENYEALIREYLKQDLRHPDSIRDFLIVRPPEIMILDTRIPGLGLREGFEVWEFFVVYDVKNDNGVYIGRDLHVVWIRDSRLIAFDYKEASLEYRIKEIANPDSAGDRF